MSPVRPGNAVSLADFITANLEPILQDWEDFAQSLVPSAYFDRATLRDHAGAMLVAIVKNMEAFQSEAERSEKGKGRGQSDQLTEAAESHAIARLTDSFSLTQLMAEFRAIRASVLRQWARALPLAEAGVEEVMRFNESVDQAITASIERYSTMLSSTQS